MVLSVWGRAKAARPNLFCTTFLSFGQPYIQLVLAARNDVIMSENTTVYVGQIRLWNSIREFRPVYRKITKLSKKMLWYVVCDELGNPRRDAKETRIWIKNADLYLGEPLETKQAE